MQEVLRRIGGCSGYDINKQRLLQLDTVAPGAWRTYSCEHRHDATTSQPLEARVQQLERHTAMYTRELASVALRVAKLKKRMRRGQHHQQSVRHVPAPVAHSVHSTDADTPTAACIHSACAHLTCEIESMTEHRGHWITLAKIVHAHVKPEYWSGKTLRRKVSSLPRILTFLGSQEFGVVDDVQPTDDCDT
eukprot:m.701381 g.701381  ORF g.701381 m.701381 type:complete len:191 (+) comp22913_c1_seq8:858-1430(+)